MGHDPDQASLPWTGRRAAPPRARPAALAREERVALTRRLQEDGRRIAERFGLTFRAILAERPGVVGHYGICYEDGLIKIRLQHATRGTPLRYSSLVNTLCHELAHLKHFDHGDAFQRFYGRILAWARRQGIYRPGRGGARAAEPSCGLTPDERRRILDAFRDALRPARPPRRQLSLFGDAP